MKRLRFSILFYLIYTLVFLQNSWSQGISKKDNLLNVKSIFELQSQKNYDSDDYDQEYSSSFLRNETYIDVNFTKKLKLHGFFVFENINPETGSSEDSLHGNDRAFSGDGIVTQNLKLVFEDESYGAFIGKFDANFGRAFNRERGIWSFEMSQSYEQIEKTGFGLFYKFKPDEILGKIKLQSSLFHNDSKILDGSTISNRNNRVVRADGTPGNNNDLKSYAISLDVLEPWSIKDLKYHLSYLSLEITDIANRNDNQTAFAANVNYIYHFSDNINFDILAEYVKINNLLGINTYERDFIVANVVTNIKDNWVITAHFSQMDDEYIASWQRENLYELSAGYKFSQGILNNFSIEAGYKYFRDINDKKTQSLGILSRYIINF